MRIGRVVLPFDAAGVSRSSDIPYREVEGRALMLDVYRPVGGDARLPVILFVHGDGPAEVLEDAKDWGQYVSWGELAASNAFAGVTFNHRSSKAGMQLPAVVSDVEAALEYVTGHATHLGLDPGRVGIWSCSLGVPFALNVAFEEPSRISCVAALYGPMDLTDVSVSIEVRQRFSPLHHLRSDRALPPALIVRAGADAPTLNETIDAFVTTALERNRRIDVINLPQARHGFDVLDDTAEARGAVTAVVDFFRTHC
jgi:acetyl esterase/lipase